jgi:beta-mannosidase
LSKEFTVGGLNTTKVYETNTAKLSLTDKTDAVLVLSLTAQGRMPNSENVSTFVHREKATAVYPNELSLVDPKLQLSYDASSNSFTVEAKAGVSLYTWLDYPAAVVGYFDDNAFTLVPGEKKTVHFTVQKVETGGKWAQGVTVRSLWDQTTA